jgi:hypothetical protein
MTIVEKLKTFEMRNFLHFKCLSLDPNDPNAANNTTRVRTMKTGRHLGSETVDPSADINGAVGELSRRTLSRQSSKRYFSGSSRDAARHRSINAFNWWLSGIPGWNTSITFRVCPGEVIKFVVTVTMLAGWLVAFPSQSIFTINSRLQEIPSLPIILPLHGMGLLNLVPAIPLAV